MDNYGADPIGDRIVLLNKIPGDDKVDEVIVDGMTIAVMSYELVDAAYKLDLRPDGAKILLPHATKRIVTVDVPREKHLNGKGVSGRSVTGCTPDIHGRRRGAHQGERDVQRLRRGPDGQRRPDESR